jgi:hypothetical protein
MAPLARDNLNYHGSLKSIDRALDFAEHFPAILTGEGQLDIEFNMDRLDIYPTSSHKFGRLIPGDEATNIIIESEYTWMDGPGERKYRVHYLPRVDIPTKVALETAKKNKG